MTTTDKIHQTLRDSAGMRWLVLLLLAFAMFCSYIFMDILSPIKDLMQSTRGWDSTAFGTMQGSETFLNVFVFFLIFAGIILDKMGVRFTAILSGAVMLVGATINWYAVTDAFQGSGLQTWFTNNLNYIPGFDELGIADADSDAAFTIGTVPALSNVMLCVDAAFHRLTAVIAPNEVAEQADGIIFIFAGFALPSCFQADCRFIHIFVYDGIILFSSCISGVIDDSCNTGFVPYGSLLRIGDLAVGQLVRNCLQGSSVQIRIENLSDNFRFFS